MAVLRMKSSLRDRVRSFVSDAAGDIALMFGLSFFAMMMLIGLAVDVGRWLNARDQTMSAMDAAVLAGGRALQTNGGNQAAALAVAERYYAAGIKNRVPTLSDTIKFTIANNGTALTATGNAFIRTPLMNAAMSIISNKNHTKLPLLPMNNAKYSTATLAVGGNAEMNLEISMMLDVSGSMSGSKLPDMKLAATDLVDIVVWADQSKFKSRVALVPFSGEVLLPASLVADVTDPSLPATIKEGSSTRNRTNCVAERGGSIGQYNDRAPGTGAWITRVYGSCSVPANGEVLPMSSDKSLIKSRINALTLGNGTAGHISTSWAHYMLSPEWADVLPSASDPTAYGNPKVQKIAILMTDGEYNQVFRTMTDTVTTTTTTSTPCPTKKNPGKMCSSTTTSTSTNAMPTAGFGLGTNPSGAQISSSINGESSSAQALKQCQDMRDDGIIVYTVGFDLGGNQTAINTLRDCASDPTKFYNAVNGNDLRQSFRDIALKISSLYLSK